MAARNEITGDLIQTKLTNTTLYESNWDKVFGNKQAATVAGVEATADKPTQWTQLDLFDEDRIDTIGANGNEGIHYEGLDNGEV
jgi:hypothetical protein